MSSTMLGCRAPCPEPDCQRNCTRHHKIAAKKFFHAHRTGNLGLAEFDHAWATANQVSHPKTCAVWMNPTDPYSTVAQDMICAYCGQRKPWDSRNFPSTLTAKCWPCALRDTERPSRKDWKAFIEKVASAFEADTEET